MPVLHGANFDSCQRIALNDANVRSRIRKPTESLDESSNKKSVSRARNSTDNGKFRKIWEVNHGN